MNEEQVQRLIAEAFQDFAQRTDQVRYLEEPDAQDVGIHVAGAAQSTADAVRPPDPDELTAPVGAVDPFAPKHTPGQWAEKIRALIRLAEADGYTAEIDSDCCGCSYGDLSLYGMDESEAFVWGRKK